MCTDWRGLGGRAAAVVGVAYGPLVTFAPGENKTTPKAATRNKQTRRKQQQQQPLTAGIYLLFDYEYAHYPQPPSPGPGTGTWW